MSKRLLTIICILLVTAVCMLSLSSCIKDDEKTDDPDIGNNSPENDPDDDEHMPDDEGNSDSDSGEDGDDDPEDESGEEDNGEQGGEVTPGPDGHIHDYVSAVGVAPGCTTKGTMVYICSCGDGYTEPIDAKGHTRVTDEAKDPTCTENGLTEGRHCAECKEILAKQEVIPALGHTEVVDEYKAPGCVDRGKTEGKHCSVCGEVTLAQKTIEPLGHTETVDAAITATCVSTGLTEGVHCSACNKVIVEQAVVPLVPHRYTNNYDATCNFCGYVRDADCEHTEKITMPGRAATCTTPGLTEGYRCKSCDEILVEQFVINAYGHSWVEATCETRKTCSMCKETEGIVLGHDLVIDKAVAPTCTEKGLTEGKHCTRCSYSVAQKKVDALGHDLVVDAAVAPTCTQSGLSEGKHCARCDFVIEQKLVAALGHDIVIDEVVAPTCTESGLTEGKHCTACGYTEKQQTVKPTGHNLIIEEQSLPTCTENGMTRGEQCTKCDYSVDREILPALGHKEVVDPAVKPTCTEPGYTEGKHCSRCNEVLAPQTEMAPMGHTEVVSSAIAPTCTTAGRTEGISCATCGAVIVRSETIPASHSWVGADCTSPRKCSVCNVTDGNPLGHTEVVDPEIKATCTNGGKTEGKHCTTCGTITVMQADMPALGHLGHTADYVCNRCGDVVPPADGSSLTISQARVLGALYGNGSYTAERYYISGIITNVYNTTYGGLYIKDSDGNELEANGLYDDGIKYGNMSVKPSVGDRITVYGPVGSGAQMLDAELASFEPHAHNYSDATCLALATCSVCGATKGDLAEHKYSGGVCTVCGTMQSVGSTKELSYAFANYPAGVQYAKNEEHILDSNTTIVVTDCHFTAQIRIYSADSYDGKVIIKSRSAITAIALNAGYKADTLVIYGSNNNGADWIRLGSFSVDSANKNYDLDFDGSYKWLMLDVEGKNQVRINNMTITVISSASDDNGDDNNQGGSGDIPDSGEDKEYTRVATFEFGENGSASHYDGSSNSASDYVEKNGVYTLDIDSINKLFTGARDGQGNSCIRLGSSSAKGSFSFTVAGDVDQVVIYVAQYKGNTTKITCNGVSYTISTSSNSGEYTAIVVGTSVNKTVEFSTASGGQRCMINTIEFYK